MSAAHLAAPAALALAAGLALSPGAAQAEPLTGCLTPGGRLVNLAPGDFPARPCRGRQQQVTLNDDDHGGLFPEPIPFFITMQAGQSVHLATVNGVIVEAYCAFGEPTPETWDDPAATTNFVAIVAHSFGADEWYATREGRTGLTIGDEVILFHSEHGGSIDPNAPSFGAAGFAPAGAMVLTADGGFLSIDGATTGLGINVLGHDCLAPMLFT